MEAVEKKIKHEIDCETRKRKLACGENQSEIKLCHWESQKTKKDEKSPWIGRQRRK